MLCRCIRTGAESSVAVFAHDIFFLGKCIISITLLDGYLCQQLWDSVMNVYKNKGSGIHGWNVRKLYTTCLCNVSQTKALCFMCILVISCLSS